MMSELSELSYMVIFISLIIIMNIYFRVAAKYNILDKPNERSSHTRITIRGGGIIFWFAAFFYFILNVKSHSIFFTGISLVAFVSFWDDIKSLPSFLRLIVQVLGVSIIFYDLSVYSLIPWWGVVIAYIVAVGILNVYNFMDGINGMTGLYTLATMLSFYYINEFVVCFVERELILYAVMASVIFLYFNFRKRAKCFAGDVGSIAIGFWVIYILCKLILATNSLIWMMLLVIYGIDSVYTILHRIYLKQNIFKPHRIHFFQILTNEWGQDQRIVSVIYVFMQCVISAIVIKTYDTTFVWIFSALVIALLTISYCCIKFRMMKLKGLAISRKESNKKEEMS